MGIGRYHEHEVYRNRNRPPARAGTRHFRRRQCARAAQVPNPCAPSAYNAFDPNYNAIDAWQSAWDTGNYDRNHVLLGTVGSFAPYRLTLLDPQGDSVSIDLKNGTVIRPTGATPASGQRVAVFGYWSNGTFIANRVVLHG